MHGEILSAVDESLNALLKDIKYGKIEVYNEFSLQHELGIKLRDELTKHSLKVQFERNIKYFFDEKPLPEFTKKEIDISIFNGETRECAIELKYPRNSAFPDQMRGFCKDVLFLEQLVDKAKFKHGRFIVFVDEKGFYEGKAPTNSFYEMFRHPDLEIKIRTTDLRGQYNSKWECLKLKNNSTIHYAVIEIIGSSLQPL